MVLRLLVDKYKIFHPVTRLCALCGNNIQTFWILRKKKGDFNFRTVNNYGSDAEDDFMYTTLCYTSQ